MVQSWIPSFGALGDRQAAAAPIVDTDVDAGLLGT